MMNNSDCCDLFVWALRRVFLPLLIVAVSSSVSFSLPMTGEGLVINEFMMSNTKVLDEDGDSSDWIEIYNEGSSTIDLGGFGLSDDNTELNKWTFPSGTVLLPGAYLLVWASDKDKNSVGAPLHASFKLSEDDGIVLLSNADQQIIHSIEFDKVPRNLSYGRHSNGNLEFFSDLTPGAANATPLTPVPQFLAKGGFYPSSISVALTAPGATIHYTTDGRTPTTGSPVYSSGISIGQTTTIRAIAVKDGYKPSPPSGQTYFIDFDRKGLPVMAISTEEENLWDPDFGIFPATGTSPGGEPVKLQKQKRPMHVDYFDGDGELIFSQDAYIQVVGNSSIEEWMRPFKISANENLDAMHSHFESLDPDKTILEKPIERFRHLAVRNNNQDGAKVVNYDPFFEFTMIRNRLMSKLVSSREDLEYRHDNGALLIVINNFNYGVGDLNEKRDNSGIEENHPGIDDDDVDGIVLRNDQFEPVYADPDNDIKVWDYYGVGLAEYEEVSDSAKEAGGTKGLEDFFSLIDFMQNNGLSDPVNYEYVKERLHLQSFLNAMAAQAITGNADFFSNNISFWREAKKGEVPGPFHTLIYDFDATSGLTYNTKDINTLALINDTSKMLAPLLKNTEFRNAFIRKVDELLNESFNSANALDIIDEIKGDIEPWMPYHLQLWGHGLITIENWQNNVNQLAQYWGHRPADVRAHVQQFFNLPGSSQLTFSVFPEGSGTITMDSGLFQSPLEGPGLYFNGAPMTLVAQNKPGFGFVRFEVNGSPVAGPIYTFSPSGSLTVQAIFEEDADAPIAPLTINEVVRGGHKQIIDEDGEDADWIEIYNSTPQAINLAGKYLTDNSEDLQKWQFPDVTIGPQSHLLVLATGKDKTDPSATLHANFKISVEPILLVDSDGKDIIDQFTVDQVSSIEEDHSGGRYPDGASTFVSMESATPGFLNVYQAPPSIATIVSPTPGSTITSTEATFQWTPGSQVEEYQFNIGPNLSVFFSQNANDFLFSYKGTAKSVAVDNIPLDGKKLYARVWSKINGQWNGGAPTTVVTYYTENGQLAVSVPSDDPEDVGPSSPLTGESATSGPIQGINIPDEDQDKETSFNQGVDVVPSAIDSQPPVNSERDTRLNTTNKNRIRAIALRAVDNSRVPLVAPKKKRRGLSSISIHEFLTVSRGSDPTIQPNRKR